MTARTKRVLTTGEVAKVCNVAPRTVSKWFDSGQLKGYRIPGSKDRRIPVSELIGFMKAHGMPLDALDLGKPRVLVLDNDPETNGILTRTLVAGGEFEVTCVSTAFEAGLAAQRFCPSVMVVDVSLPDIRAEALCCDVRAIRQLQGLKLIAVGTGLTDGAAQAALQAGFDACLPKPLRAEDLTETIRAVLERV